MDILVKPIVTEKMTAQGERFSRYGFVVRRTATKQQIKKAVESMYGVSVEAVNTMVYGGKMKSRFTKAVDLWEDQFLQEGDRHAGEGESIDFIVIFNKKWQ